LKVIEGKYNNAVIFTDNIEEKAAQQIKELCNQRFASGSRIRIMPDAHAGAGCTIGTTMTIQDKIVPNLVGVDIGCGMHVSLSRGQRLTLRDWTGLSGRMCPAGFPFVPYHMSIMLV